MNPSRGDLVIFNTCCVRENAEEKVYGHIGALKGIKREKPDMVTAVCGCMTEQPHVLAEIQKKYRNVDLVFGTRNQHRFPEFLYHCIFDGKRVYELSATEGEVAEGVPILRDSPVKAWVTIMYGCNNFCSYCIVPYVRGRERSRQPADILQEVRKLSEAGVKEITLLGRKCEFLWERSGGACRLCGITDPYLRRDGCPADSVYDFTSEGFIGRID